MHFSSEHCSNQTEMNTDPAREIFVNLHNSYRATVAKGGLQMTNGKKSRACPRMKQLLISSYSCALEAEAYATAKQCLTTDPDVENENWFIATAANKKEAATKAMEAWYNEITTSYMVQATGSQNLLLPSLKIRHFARIVWDLNTQVGCAVHKCGNKFHAVCRYGKGVGVYGSPIYFMGPRACNQCLDKCVDGALCPP
ncbi:hypothetical protein Y032_0009g459 [Ancylostoma ceylanicum]|uniref:SCP domain-containing protein n=1 Tax=Ancylostoma ceylanicum TaxID=53326 RepID=A0A016VIX9_9BILA|nr:hypothetical protein Y032_0009g459 [Ancylostoma ceylanicum]